MGHIALRDYLDVSYAPNEDALLDRLVGFVGRWDFGTVSAVLLDGDIANPEVRGKSISNTPAGFVEMSKSLNLARRDPVMRRLMQENAPFIWDRKTYESEGVGDLWEAQAPWGYSTGIAVSLRLDKDSRFLIGIDRPTKLPRGDRVLTELLDGFQTLAVHAQLAAQRLFPPGGLIRMEAVDTSFRLSDKEREVMLHAKQGRTAWHTSQLMSITERTVNFHLQEVMKRLGVSSKMQAVVALIERGLL